MNYKNYMDNRNNDRGMDGEAVKVPEEGMEEPDQ